MQLQDDVQRCILPKHIVLAITHAILARFSSKYAQNVRIFKEYHMQNWLYYVGNQSQRKPVKIGL